MKKIAFSLCMILAAALAFGAETLTMATEATFPPYEFLRGQEIVGIDGILFKQTAGSILGLIIMTVLSTVNYKGLEKYYKILYGIVIIALAAVLVFGTSGGGARRWIGIGGITFQPSELAKILLILFYSEFIINYMGTISRWKVFALSTLSALPTIISKALLISIFYLSFYSYQQGFTPIF